MADPGEAGTGAASASPVTIVTGATEGVGLELARRFAGAGDDLLLVARTRKRLDAAADAISGEFGVSVHVLAADLATPQGCASVEQAVQENGLYARYLVNNAGLGQCGPFAAAGTDTLTAITDLNMRAPTDLARRFLPGMLERNEGGVLNVSSLAGFLPGPYQATYYASKAFLLSLSEALAHEASGTKVRVAVLAPGPVKTDFHERMDSESAFYIRFLGLESAERVAQIGYANFKCGQRVIVPGAYTMLTALVVRILPHIIVTPFAAWLLKRRDEPQNA